MDLLHSPKSRHCSADGYMWLYGFTGEVNAKQILPPQLFGWQIMLLLPNRVCDTTLAGRTRVTDGWIWCLSFHLLRDNEQANLLGGGGGSQILWVSEMIISQVTELLITSHLLEWLLATSRLIYIGLFQLDIARDGPMSLQMANLL